MEKQQLSFFEDREKERKKITLSLDKLYLVGVFFLIAFIVAFSLGVEKGKRLNPAVLNTQLPDDQIVMDNTYQPEEAGTQTAAQIDAAPQERLSQEKPQTQEVEEAIEKGETQEPGLYYSIQVASYKSSATAKTEANNLKKEGFEPVIIRPGSPWTALCVGKFKTISEAKEFVKSLKNRYSDCFVREL